MYMPALNTEAMKSQSLATIMEDRTTLIYVTALATALATALTTALAAALITLHRTEPHLSINGRTYP